MATRHQTLSFTEVRDLNEHLKYEGARCCFGCRDIYLLDQGGCHRCQERHRAYQQKYHQKYWRDTLKSRRQAAREAVR